MKRDWIRWIGAAGLLIACSSEEPQTVEVDPAEVIHVAGLQTDLVTVTTRATDYPDAEKIEWLKPSLQAGLDITYWHEENKANTEKVAVLKLNEDESSYSFNYKGNNKPAQWYGNGFHRFQGFRVPTKLSDGNMPKGLTTDQSDGSEDLNNLGNYTLLNRYLCMPPNCRIAATVEQIRLPFQHRLARVLAYVLIDPEMGPYVKLEGDSLKDGSLDPKQTNFWFTKVKVLEKIISTTSDQGVTTYKPQWSTDPVSKVIPHFVGRLGSESHQGIDGRPKDNFYVYVNKKTEERIFPSESRWQSIHEGYEAYIKDNPQGTEHAYTRIDYGQVPCFDLIVRPTYSSSVNVMYDEAVTTDPGKNSITFELKLNNGLRYQKYFEFDLNANQQTVVYLQISREKIDYDQSGSEQWEVGLWHDGYYGVNNEGGHSLSMAGSSWQRAYRNDKGSGPTDIADGSNYNENDQPDNNNSSGEDGQYLSDDKWKELFKTAIKDGTHHGDYFILTKDITIDVSSLPANFIFTGHLDGRGHTITLTGTRSSTGESSSTGEGSSAEGGSTASPYLFDGLNGIYDGQKGEANLHEENGQLVPVKGYRAEVMNLTVSGGTLFKSDATYSGTDLENSSATVTGSVLNCIDANGHVKNDVGMPQYK